MRTGDASSKVLDDDPGGRKRHALDAILDSAAPLRPKSTASDTGPYEILSASRTP
jgi:hypothetical protein